MFMLYIYESFLEFVNFLHVCLCPWVCVCMCVCIYLCGYACLWSCKHYGKFIPLCLCGWVRFSSARFLCMIRAKPDLFNPDSSEKLRRLRVFFLGVCETRLITQLCFVFFLSSLLHHWCGSVSKEPGQIQFLNDHASLSLNSADSIKSSK